MKHSLKKLILLNLGIRYNIMDFNRGVNIATENTISTLNATGRGDARLTNSFNSEQKSFGSFTFRLEYKILDKYLPDKYKALGKRFFHLQGYFMKK